jgi:hypothetical protein
MKLVDVFRTLACFCVSAVFVACAPASSTFTPSSATRFPARQAECDFVVLTALPDAPVVQVGIIDVDQGNWGGIKSAADFKSLAAPQVCSSGGEIVVAEVNGFGQYVRGSVFRAAPGATSQGGSATGGPTSTEMH